MPHLGCTGQSSSSSRALAEAQRVSPEQVSIHCGTDECASALAGRPGRTAGPGLGGPPSACMWSGWPGISSSPQRYEDRAVCPKTWMPTWKPAASMRVHEPGGCPGRAWPSMRPEARTARPGHRPGGGRSAPIRPSRLGQILAERLPCPFGYRAFPLGLLDVYHANGGESSLLRLAAQQRLLLARLAAYAGWNTAMQLTGHHPGPAPGRGALPGRHPPLWHRFYSRAPAGRLDLSGNRAPPVEPRNCGLPVWMSGILPDVPMLPTRGYSS